MKLAKIFNSVHQCSTAKKTWIDNWKVIGIWAMAGNCVMGFDQWKWCGCSAGHGQKLPWWSWSMEPLLNMVQKVWSSWIIWSTLRQWRSDDLDEPWRSWVMLAWGGLHREDGNRFFDPFVIWVFDWGLVAAGVVLLDMSKLIWSELLSSVLPLLHEPWSVSFFMLLLSPPSKFESLLPFIANNCIIEHMNSRNQDEVRKNINKQHTPEFTW